MSWQDKHPVELQQLLRFFVAKTKQDNAAHVLLCTSEYGFMSWLDHAIGDSFWRPVVIGNFSEADARGYLEDYLGVGRLSEDDWAKVYQVCGGNPGFLGLVADEFADPSTSADWHAVLKAVWVVTLQTVEAAAVGGSGGWTAAQYADAALMLLARKHHAVPMKQMQAQLGRHSSGNAEQQLAAGKEALAALVRANALSLRPFSHWAQDIPTDAFGMTWSTLVTAPSQVHLHCMRNNKDNFEDILQRWEQQEQDKQQEALTSAQQRPGSPSSPEVRQVREQIKEVEQEIKEVIADIRAAKQANDKEEVASLRRSQEQLRLKEQSLREKELFLLKSE
eukprot:jgi/Chrzof1/9092/Cz03g35230.t1